MIKSPEFGTHTGLRKPQRRHIEMQTAKKMQFEGCGVKPRTILVKIGGIGEQFVAGIHEKTRDEMEMDKRREQEARELGINRGTIRDGQIDTGTQVVNAQSVILTLLFADLAFLGYVLTDVHWFFQKKEGKPGRRVVVMTYSQKGENTAEIQIPESLKRVLAWIWGFCNTWCNMREDGESLYRLDTINVSTGQNRSFSQSLRTNFDSNYFSYQLDSPH
ncbi:MAG: hypothetical protein PHN19_05565 [Patescibacteria group bacterium]|nr:hypothetical protein [Patescibacteria group bacterium]